VTSRPDHDEEMRQRLEALSVRLARTHEKLHSGDRREGTRHIEHLDGFEKEHEALAARLEQADASAWERMRATLQGDLKGLTERFETWVEEVDETYERGKG